MKTVLHLLPMNKMSGAEKMVLLISKNLDEYKSVVVTGGENLAQYFIQEKITTYHSNFSLNQTLRLTKQLNQIIAKHNIDIIHAHDNIASIAAYFTKKRYKLNIKIISHIHNCYPWLKGNSINKKIDTLIRPKYDYNIACGQLVFDYYSKWASYFDIKKSISLSNAIDINQIRNFKTSYIDDVRDYYKIPNDKMILGFIGRLSEQKGLIPFIKELQKYREEFKDCIFLLVGGGEQEEEIKYLIKDNNLEELFILTGFQQDVYPFYKIIDVFFLPSLYEGLPMVLLEAMSFSCPIVSMDVGSINEVVKHDETGFLVNSNDYGTFLNYILELKNDPQKMGQFRKNSLNYIEKYDIQFYINELKTIYKKVDMIR